MSLYTPWTEEWTTLHARTRGRDEAIADLVQGARQLLGGQRALPLYFYGPRGIGKSHVVIDGLGQVRAALEEGGFSVVSVSEDAAEVSDADVLWARLTPNMEPAWMAWHSAPPSGPRRALVIFEGLDRQLKALGLEGRRKFRALLDAHPDVWIVATGARLSDELVRPDDAFYGAFRPVPIQPLPDPDAAALVDHEAGEGVRAEARWPGRRAAIVVLAGGNPRALVALGRAIREVPGQEVARRLFAVLDEFTPHYQLRFRDLGPQEQQLVELLTQAPRELGPTEIAVRLGSVPASWSTCAHRLSDVGVVRIRQDGRQAWYRLAEPLFRYWLEFRSAPWGEARVAWLGELLELVLAPDELVDLSRHADEALRTGALRAVKRKPEARLLAWKRCLEAVEAALSSRDPQAIDAASREAAAMAPSAKEAWSLARTLAVRGQARVGRALGPALIEHGSKVLGRLLSSRGDQGELRELLTQLSSRRTWTAVGQGVPGGQAVVAYLDLAASEIDPRGSPWVLKAAERRALWEIPFLRGRLARHGRRPSHAALLDESDLLQAPLDAGSPDLADLLWVTVAREQRSAAARVLAVMREAPKASLPWCPWPGRRLVLEPEGVFALVERQPSVAALSWLASTIDVSDASFAALLERPELAELRHAVFSANRLHLALSAVAFARPERLEALRRALAHPSWREVFERVDLLVRQLREGERGPLHPELARVYEVVRPHTLTARAAPG